MSESSRLAPYIPRIPVLATAGRALNFIFTNIRAIAICAAVPLLAGEAIWFTCYFLIGDFWDEILFGFAHTLPATFFVVALCRLALLGPQEAPARSLTRWNRPHWEVAKIQFVILLILMPTQDLFVPLVVETQSYISYFGFGVYVVAFFGCLAITLRIALAQPSHAVEAPMTIGRAWDLSREQGLRLLVTTHLAALPYILGDYAVNVTFESLTELSHEWPDDDRLAAFDWRLVPLSFAHAVMGYLNMAAKFLVLSFTFRLLAGWRGPQHTLLERFD